MAFNFRYNVAITTNFILGIKQILRMNFVITLIFKIYFPYVDYVHLRNHYVRIFIIKFNVRCN